AGRGGGARPGRVLVGGGVGRVRGRAADEDMFGDARRLAGIAVSDAIDSHGIWSAIGPVQTTDPGSRCVEETRPARHDKDRITATDRLELDGVLTKTAFTGINDLFQLRYDRLWSAVVNWVDSYRLSAHPVWVERERRFDCRLAFGASPLDQQEVATGIHASRARLHCKAVEQLGKRWRRYISQRKDRNAVTRLRPPDFAIDVAGANGF